MRPTSGAGILERGFGQEWLHSRIIPTPTMEDLSDVEGNGEIVPAEVAPPVGLQELPHDRVRRRWHISLRHGIRNRPSAAHRSTPRHSHLHVLSSSTRHRKTRPRSATSKAHSSCGPDSPPISSRELRNLGHLLDGSNTPEKVTECTVVSANDWELAAAATVRRGSWAGVGKTAGREAERVLGPLPCRSPAVPSPH